jgi:hypothetical protein
VLISFVLRLVPEELAEGRLAGEIEAVHTGERALVSGVADLGELISDLQALQRRTQTPTVP